MKTILTTQDPERIFTFNHDTDQLTIENPHKKGEINSSMDQSTWWRWLSNTKKKCLQDGIQFTIRQEKSVETSNH